MKMTPGGEAERPQNAANLLSTVGAGVAGLGGGILLSAALDRLGWWLLGLGAAVHFAAMLGKRRLQDRRGYSPAAWEQAGYWLCWAALGILAAFVAIELF